MNPFYKRLLTFGHLVQYLSQVNHTNYEEYFELVHPGHPVFGHKARVKPRLSFVKRCSKKERTEIISLFNECFS